VGLDVIDLSAIQFLAHCHAGGLFTQRRQADADTGVLLFSRLTD
jgi:hypothetical protein